MIIQHRHGAYSIEFLALDQLGLDPGSPVITDSNLAGLYPDFLQGFSHVKVVPAGEASKSLAVFGECLEWLVGVGAHRKTEIIAFGGGVVGDLVGFVASAYMRGIRFVQVPASLLAQVDSSVGGKVGIDLVGGKNLAGAFHPPSRVLVCQELLQTLPERQLINGAAEVWKYGAIMDLELMATLRAQPIRPGQDLTPIVQRCIELKAQVVQEDEFETTGRRAILNFGHTIGHAIEKVLHYETLLHGEAISIGMMLEAELGEKLGITEPGTATILRDDLTRQGLPTALPEGLDAPEILRAMHSDKKSLGQGLSFSFLTSLGTCKLVHGVEQDHVLSVLKRS